MIKDTRKLIEQFIKEIKEKYKKIYVDYTYDKEDNIYEIWHNDFKLEYEDESFKKFVGNKAQEILFDNGVFNFYFTYDHFKTKELNNKHKLYSTAILNKVSYKYIEDTHNEKRLSYNKRENQNLKSDVSFKIGKNIEFTKNRSLEDVKPEYKINQENIKKLTLHKYYLPEVAS